MFLKQRLKNASIPILDTANTSASDHIDPELAQNYANEDEEILAKVIKMQQWQQQKTSQALTQSEPGLVNPNVEQDELLEEYYG